MKAVSDLVGGIHSLKQAKQYFESFSREMGGGTAGDKLAKVVLGKIDFSIRELVTFPHFPTPVVHELKKEIDGDNFMVQAIAEKAYRLREDQREMVELMVDSMLAGEEINFLEKA